MIRTVHFLELDHMDDYMVSFWLDERGRQHATLLRSLEYEPDLAPEDRPRTVFYTHERVQPAGDLLVAAEWDQNRVHLRTQTREFVLDVSRIRQAESLALAKLILKRMNYDGSFDIVVRRGPKKAGARAKMNR